MFQNPYFLKIFPCISAIYKVADGILPPERAAIICGISPNAVTAAINGDIETLERELENTEFGAFLTAYRLHAGVSLISMLYEARKILEIKRSDSVGDAFNTILSMLFGTTIPNAYLFDLAKCLRKEAEIVYIDSACKKEVLAKAGAEGKNIAEGLETAIAMANMFRQWQNQ